MSLNIENPPPIWCGRAFFHPAISPWGKNKMIMTMQSIHGSDYFGPVEWSISEDNGNTWLAPKAIESLDVITQKGSLQEGVADVRPFYHEHTQKIIAIGCNTYYRNGKVDLLGKPQFPVYAILSPNGSWSQRYSLRAECFNGFDDYRVACTQLVIMPDGDIFIPLYLRKDVASKRYSVCTVRCSFDGERLEVKSHSNFLSHPFGRGLLEPSLVFFNDRFYMTIRAEDGNGYFSTSSNGLDWSEIKPWAWNTGETIQTSTTQQHWLNINGYLYLIYTRKTPENTDVVRWRAPLFISRFNQQDNTLIRKTEQTIFPLKYRHSIPNLMGNFHVCTNKHGEGLVSDSSWWQSDPCYTEVWQARIKSTVATH